MGCKRDSGRGVQDRWDAIQEGFKTGVMQERRDAGNVRFRTGTIQDRRDT